MYIDCFPCSADDYNGHDLVLTSHGMPQCSAFNFGKSTSLMEKCNRMTHKLGNLYKNSQLGTSLWSVSAPREKLKVN